MTTAQEEKIHQRPVEGIWHGLRNRKGSESKGKRSAKTHLDNCTVKEIQKGQLQRILGWAWGNPSADTDIQE